MKSVQGSSAQLLFSYRSAIAPNGYMPGTVFSIWAVTLNTLERPSWRLMCKDRDAKFFLKLQRSAL